MRIQLCRYLNTCTHIYYNHIELINIESYRYEPPSLSSPCWNKGYRFWGALSLCNHGLVWRWRNKLRQERTRKGKGRRGRNQEEQIEQRNREGTRHEEERRRKGRREEEDGRKGRGKRKERKRKRKKQKKGREKTEERKGRKRKQRLSFRKRKGKEERAYLSVAWARGVSLLGGPIAAQCFVHCRVHTYTIRYHYHPFNGCYISPWLIQSAYPQPKRIEPLKIPVVPSREILVGW